MTTAALLLLLALAVLCAGERVVYYRRVVANPQCRVYGARTVCTLPDDDAAVAAAASDSLAFVGAVEPLLGAGGGSRDGVRDDAATASWGLDRVDQRTLPLSGTYSPDRSGAASTVWILSSGVAPDSDEFSGRATTPFAVDEPQYDCNGAGTELAAIVGGDTYGVANFCALRGVKVLGCNGGGSTGALVDGLAYVLSVMVSRNVVLVPYAYLGRNAAVEAAVEDLLAAEASVVAGAGDLGINSCSFFPGAQAGVIAVAATRDNDARYSYSNYGPCVDLFAPGHRVATLSLGDVATNITTTQAAAAYVAGALAQVLQGSPSANGTATLANLLARATQDQVTSPHSTPNRLLYVLQDTNPPQPSAVPSAAAPHARPLALVAAAAAALAVQWFTVL